MDSQIEIVEGRLKSFLVQLQTEYGVLHRMVYKNKNQHRRCSYFQYLLKVRSDLRLLQSTQLEELVNSSFLVINGDRAKQKVQLLESLKRRKRDGGKHNFLERLRGAAHLLSQMVEPMLKASTLHAFRANAEGIYVLCLPWIIWSLIFMWAWRQILLDVVSVFNLTSSLSQKEQSIKIAQQGFEVFREYYPTNERAVFLECVWETDKYRLLERISEPEHKSQDMHKVEEIPRPSSTIQYQSIETLLGDEESDKGVPNKTSEENHGNINPEPSKDQVDNCLLVEDGSEERGNSTAEDSLHTSSSPQSNPPKFQSAVKSKVAFIQVRKPAASTNETGIQIKPTESNSDDKEDTFFGLLTSRIVKNSFL